MQKPKRKQVISPEWKAILNTLMYFDVFAYPLRAEEIARNCSHKGVSTVCVRKALSDMVRLGWLGEKAGLFYLGNDPEKCERRLKGNAFANSKMPKARKISRFIGSFPFVRAVMISGSLSKGYLDEEGDIDFFIVTEPGRLWVSRTILVLYKKLFLGNSHKYFCVNYFVDTHHLGIEDRNHFTATEVVYLIPTYNPVVYQDFRNANSWADKWYPNFGFQPLPDCHPEHRPFLKRSGEWLLKGRFGEFVDRWCMRKTLKHWKKKFSHFRQEDFELGLRSRTYVSKHHPSNFQIRVLNRIQQKQMEFEEQYQVSLL